MTSFSIQLRKLKVEEYQTLRKTTGWDMHEDKVAELSLENDLFSVVVYDKDTLIGMGRVVGDGYIYFYIQDIVVTPDYKGRGVGKLIMENVEAYLSKAANNNSFIGLMAAEGVKEFYYKFGYKERPESRPGMFKVVKL